MKIEIRKVTNGFVFTLSGDQANRQVKASGEMVAGSVTEMIGLLAERLKKVYGEDHA